MRTLLTTTLSTAALVASSNVAKAGDFDDYDDDDDDEESGYYCDGGPDGDDDDEDERPLVDMSTWLRLGASWGETDGNGLLASQSGPDAEPIKFDVGFATAIGVDATIGVSAKGDFRIGPWAEVAITDFDTITPSAGLEAQFGLLPRKLRWFQYAGQGQLTARVGGGRSFGASLPNSSVVVGALTWGYLAPWNLAGYESGCHSELISRRYMIGARVVATVMASTEDPDFWLATVGLEIEPVGAIRYLFGIRDWY